MRIYLINPGIDKDTKFIREGRCMQKAASWATVWPPIGLCILAAIARRRGEARLRDCNVEYLPLDKVIDEIKEFGADLVVVNTGFPSIEYDMTAAREIKRAIPSCRIAAYGVYFTLLSEQGMSKYPFLDFCLVGEPEETFGELIELLSEKSLDFSKVKGLGYNNGRVVINPKRDLIADLDKLPLPARGLINNGLYRLPHNNKIFTLINAARGCPYQCIFCTVKHYYGCRVRKHSIKYVMDELRECVDNYKITEFFFWEEVFTMERDYCLELCEAIAASNLRISWVTTTRVDCVDDELLKAMKKAGCYLLGLGIESSDQAILDKAKKKSYIKDVEKAVRLCKNNGIKTMGHFIFGLPGETRKTAEETIRFMLGLGLDYAQCYCAVPYPGTELGDMAKKEGWIVSENWADYDLGGRSVMNLPAISCDEITGLRTKALKKFYFRLPYILKTIFGGFSPIQMLKAVKFTKWIKPKGKI